MKLKADHRVILINNFKALGIHLILMAIFLPLNILAPLLVPLYLMMYVWIGYRFLQITNRPHYLSVALVLLLSAVSIAPSLWLGVFPIERGEAWMNVWVFFIPLIADIFIPIVNWNGDGSAGTLTILGYAGVIIGSFIPSSLFIFGMFLREKKLNKSSNSDRGEEPHDQ